MKKMTNKVFGIVGRDQIVDRSVEEMRQAGREAGRALPRIKLDKSNEEFAKRLSGKEIAKRVDACPISSKRAIAAGKKA